MDKEKKIYFCEIDYDDRADYKRGKLESLLDIFEVYFGNDTNQRVHRFNNKDIEIRIEQRNKDFIFGIYAYQTDFKKEMVRPIDDGGNPIEDFAHRLEYYSFFLIDVAKKKLAYIYNQRLPKASELFVNLVKSDPLLYMFYFCIIPISIPDVIERIKTFSNITVDLRLHTPEAPEFIGAGGIDDFTITKTEHSIKVRKARTFFDRVKSYIPFCKKFNASGTIHIGSHEKSLFEEKKEVINLLQNTFSRSAKIDVAKLDYNNTDSIRKILEEELFSALCSQNIQQPSAEERLENPENNQIKIDFYGNEMRSKKEDKY